MTRQTACGPFCAIPNNFELKKKREPLPHHHTTAMGHIGSARYCRGPLLPQPVIAATNFDIVLEYLDKRTNEPCRLTTGRRACLQCTGLRVPIPTDVAKTSARGRPFSLCKRFFRQ